MIRVGVVGLGFMGRVHFKNYKSNDNVIVAAVCDIDKDKLKGTDRVTGNIAGSEDPLDFKGIELYTDFDKMLSGTQLDAISITLPTNLHRDFTIKALKKGLHVLCEKPMALNLAECKDMISAAKESGKILQIGQCIRFWPEYAKTKELIDSGRYGKVRVATFQRLSLTPGWSWQNWLMDGKRSGGSSLDMHIHDTDFVQYLLGMPKAVRSNAITGPSGDFDHIVTSYIYNDDKVVTAEGGWIMADGFGFEMSFNIILEKATIVFDITKKPGYKVCTTEGETLIPELEPGDGYSIEIIHFIKNIAGEKLPIVTTPEQSLDSVRIILAEKESAKKGKQVDL